MTEVLGLQEAEEMNAGVMGVHLIPDNTLLYCPDLHWLAGH